MSEDVFVSLAPFGGPASISVCALTKLAALAKTRVKASPMRGHLGLSMMEIIALAWFADLLLEDDPPSLPREDVKPKDPPKAISNL